MKGKPPAAKGAEWEEVVSEGGGQPGRGFGGQDLHVPNREHLRKPMKCKDCLIQDPPHLVLAQVALQIKKAIDVVQGAELNTKLLYPLETSRTPITGKSIGTRAASPQFPLPSSQGPIQQ
ncbi:uncharacterized protein EMH_0098870 [Eimeria mitis]|uniref:Uncharacterized protein n=1 Tax=Eimeria mitis TaxID=44415 RepID=U6JN36_9EIME|nr:uncharacterized protein EMH_0098870 [Eimeria mitis]CDJ26919.1 hypothetical protein, conserved [Eimeria mitis]